VCPYSSSWGVPVRASHTVAVSLPVTMRLPSGLNATLDPGRVNGMAREVSLSGFSPVARLKIRP